MSAIDPVPGEALPTSLQALADRGIDIAENLALQCWDTAKAWVTESRPSEREGPLAVSITEQRLRVFAVLMSAASTITAALIDAEAVGTAEGSDL